jgi:selenocysteine-specific elongation factor
MLALGAVTLGEVLARANLDEQTARQAFAELHSNGQLLVLETPNDQTESIPFHPTLLVTSFASWEQLASRARQEVEAYHRTNPLRRGLPREELKSRLKLTPRLFNAVMRRLVSEGQIKESGPLVFKPGYTIQFTQIQKRQMEALLASFATSPYAPPTTKDCINEVGDDLYNAMVDLELLTPVPPDVVFRTEDYNKMVAEIRRLLGNQETVSAAEVRDHFKTSRRYALAILEYLDSQGVTVREGDVRRLKQV